MSRPMRTELAPTPRELDIRTYDPAAALSSIDANVAWVLAFFAIAAVATFIYLLQSFKLARAHEAYSSALPAVGWFAVHDLHFVLLYELWFDVYDHWWVKAWWVALVFTTLIEFALVGMIVKYGRKELAPWASQRQFFGLIALGTVAIGVIWLLVKDSMRWAHRTSKGLLQLIYAKVPFVFHNPEKRSLVSST